MRTTYWRDLRARAGVPASDMEWRQRWLMSFRSYWVTLAAHRPPPKFTY
jgi:hypothetical protein